MWYVNYTSPSCLAVQAQSDLLPSLPSIDKTTNSSTKALVFRSFHTSSSWSFLGCGCLAREGMFSLALLLRWSAAQNPTNFTPTSPSHSNLPSRASVLTFIGTSCHSLYRVELCISASFDHCSFCHVGDPSQTRLDINPSLQDWAPVTSVSRSALSSTPP